VCRSANGRGTWQYGPRSRAGGRSSCSTPPRPGAPAPPTRAASVRRRVPPFALCPGQALWRHLRFRPPRPAARPARPPTTRRGGRRAPHLRAGAPAESCWHRHSTGRPFADGHRNLCPVAGSAKPQRDNLPDAVRPELTQEPLHMPDRLVVPGDNDVALVNARCGTGTVRIDAHHHGAKPFLARDRDRLKTNAQISAGNPAVFFEFLRHALDRRRWNDERAPAWPEDGHSNPQPARIEHESAFCASP